MKDFPEIPLKSQYVFSAQYKDRCLTPKSWQPKQRGGHNPPHRERCVTATHNERKWSHSSPEILVGRKGRESKSEDVKELSRRVGQRYFKGGGERHQINSSSPSGWARRVHWGCRSHSTACAFGTAVPVSWAGQEQPPWVPLITELELGGVALSLWLPKSNLGTQAVSGKELQMSVLLQPRDGLRGMELTRNNLFHFSFSASYKMSLKSSVFLKIWRRTDFVCAVVESSTILFKQSPSWCFWLVMGWSLTCCTEVMRTALKQLNFQEGKHQRHNQDPKNIIVASQQLTTSPSKLSGLFQLAVSMTDIHPRAININSI